MAKKKSRIVELLERHGDDIVELRTRYPDIRQNELADHFGFTAAELSKVCNEIKNNREIFKRPSRAYNLFIVLIATEFDSRIYEGLVESNKGNEFRYQEYVYAKIRWQLEKERKKYPGIAPYAAQGWTIHGDIWDLQVAFLSKNVETLSNFVIEKIRTTQFVKSTKTTMATTIQHEVFSFT